MCIIENCIKTPGYNFKNLKAKYCKEHKTDGMIDVKHASCIFDNCSNRPSYNLDTEKKPLYCQEHKTDLMININTKKCLECGKIPGYNFKNLKAKYCKEHAKDGMIDIKHLACESADCKTQASFNTKGLKKPLFCAIHKTKDMVDVTHPSCKSCGLFRVSKIGVMCSYCNPPKRMKTKELIVNELF
jgi:hypothetical protein